MALLLALAGCGGGHAYEQDVTEALGTETGSPLLVLFGLDGTSDTDRNLSGEAAVADCMAREGFDYVVEPLPGPAGLDTGPLGGPPDLETVETSGYGVADGAELQLSNATNPFDGNPQAEILEQLSEGEIADYRRALTGITDDEAVFDEIGQPVDPQTGEPLNIEQLRDAMADGCSGLAAQDLLVQNAELLGSDLYFEAQNLVLSEHRMVELQDEWHRCMARQGYDYANQGEILGELYSRAETIMAQVDRPMPGAPGEPMPELDPDQVAAATEQLDLLGTVEVTIARADFGCSADLFAEAPQIARRVEKQFIEDNESRLVELMEATIGDTN